MDWKFWVRSSCAILLVIAAIIFLSKYQGLKWSEAAGVVSATVAAIGFLLTYKTLRANHEWNRRQFMIIHSSRWNEHARPHLNFLEKEFPSYFNVVNIFKEPHRRSEWQMNAEIAVQCCRQTDDRSIEIRNHLIALFNHFENLALAYQLQVVDRDAVDDTLAVVITDVYLYFLPFIEEMRKMNRSDPWPPLSRLVTKWISKMRRQVAEQTLKDIQKQEEDAIRDAEDRNKTDQ